MNFFIVNNTDRPDRKHVTQLIDSKKGKLEYLSEELRAFGTLYIGIGSTNILDFGFEITSENKKIRFKKVRDSVAQYSDGRPRRWQGIEEDFLLEPKA